MKTYTIELTEQELSVIAAALHERPYRIVAPVLAKLQSVVDAQQTAEQQKAE